MFTSLNDFRPDFTDERNGTLKILAALTDASLAQSVANDHRTIGRMACHIVTTYPEMMKLVGLSLDRVDQDAPLPSAAKEIHDAYETVSAQLLEQLASWDDAKLLEENNCYGMMWKNGLTLEVLIRHEVHHRAQMTVLMRQAGLTVPGIYGPAKEGWAAMGMEPPVV